mgnify:CR=1 FL=1
MAVEAMDVEAVVAVMMKMLAMDAAAKAVTNTAMTETMDAEAMGLMANGTGPMSQEVHWHCNHRYPDFRSTSRWLGDFL